MHDLGFRIKVFQEQCRKSFIEGSLQFIREPDNKEKKISKQSHWKPKKLPTTSNSFLGALWVCHTI